jgi:hypothetical protein
LRASSSASALKFFLASRCHRVCIGDRGPTHCRYPEPLPGAAQSVGSSCWGTGSVDWCRKVGVGGGQADVSHRTQPASGVRHNTGLIFLYMLREPAKLSTPGDRACVHCRSRPHRLTSQATLRHPAAGLA